MIKALVSKGNTKLPRSTWIFNSGSATNCPSRELGLCQAGKLCYALKAERIYPAVLPYREKQFMITQKQHPTIFALQLIAESKRAYKNPMKAFRFNESGDFINQSQVEWFASVCKTLKANKVKCYGYTARTDLDLTGLLEVASVNVSNDRENWITKGANRFKMVLEASGKNRACAGDCRICNICQRFKGKTIEVVTH